MNFFRSFWKSQFRPSPGESTLAQFIEENSKLITGFAAFIALTAFSNQLDNANAKLEVSGLAFLGAFLLAYELLMRLPTAPWHWRLQAFGLVLLCLVGFMGGYWIREYQPLWVGAISPLTITLVLILVFLGLPLLLAISVTRLVRIIAMRFFHHHISTDMLQRLNQIIFFSLFAFLVLSVGLIGVWYQGRKIPIHIPFLK